MYCGECGYDGEDLEQQIKDLQAQIDTLTEENSDLKTRIEDCAIEIKGQTQQLLNLI
jgi:cell division septum initiation protein DivIVA